MRKSSYPSGTPSASATIRSLVRNPPAGGELKSTTRKPTLKIARSGRTSGPSPTSSAAFPTVRRGRNRVQPAETRSRTEPVTTTVTAQKDPPSQANVRPVSSPEVVKSQTGRSTAATTRPSGRAIPARPACRQSRDRKSTRLNSSHDQISYAVFCLKKKKKHRILEQRNK